jgi:hypothetical protein
MKKPLTELFLYELDEQCNFAILAYDNIINAIKNKEGDKVWLYLELFLIAAAKISIIFWPQGRKHKKRGEELRNLLAIDETVAFATRDPRNHLEHFDERLDEWYDNSTHHNLANKVILPEITFMTGNIDHLRTFLTKRFVFKFLDKEYEINPIKDSIVELLFKVEGELNKFHPKGFP